MFIGEFLHSIDNKGRVAIPAKFRPKLSEGAIVTRGLDRCLFVYSKKEWLKLAKRIATLPISQTNTRAFSRLMLAGAMDVRLDKQGRIVIPEYLRTYSKIKKRVAIVGLFNRLEIWPEEEWQKYKANTEKKGNEIAERLGEISSI